MIFAVNRNMETLSFAMLWLTAYTWLLRLPSEALPLCVGSPDMQDAGRKQTLIWRDGDVVSLRLLRRKNRPQGSGTMQRMCTCVGNTHTCVVHTLWDKFLGRMPVGSQPWQGISASEALLRLRRVLGYLQVPDAESYRTQDLRRGHAEDMRQSGAPLAEILKAGQWKSAAFLNYLDEAGGALLLGGICAPCVSQANMEKELAYAVAIESDVEEWID